jgi:hypothetical protein
MPRIVYAELPEGSVTCEQIGLRKWRCCRGEFWLLALSPMYSSREDRSLNVGVSPGIHGAAELAFTVLAFPASLV